MKYILVSFSFLIICIAVHIIFNKIHKLIGIPRFFLYGIFATGFIGCSITNISLIQAGSIQMSLPLTSIFLFGSMSLAYLSLVESPSLEDQSPTTKLLIAFLRKGSQTEKQLIKLFKFDEIIKKRINDLSMARFIEKNGNTLVLTQKGMFVAQFFLLYRKLLGLSEGG